ncbi:MAG: hypothetical protein PF542_01005, partial [Nanoarchaeota archaeon]|nr:hypothetical protein [Nanoarchaeota archaeon]
MSTPKEQLKPVLDIIQNKKVQNIAVIVIFLATLFLGIQIRTSGLNNLIDTTTGDYTPLALDPYYFLRISETLIANDGVLPAVDDMRYQAIGPGWSAEILPHSTVWIYKTMKIVNPETTLNFADVLNPVVFFALGLIIFFILAWVVTKNKWIATIGSIILTVIPPYLYRTLAGFSDHEAIGMFGFFLALLAFALGMFYLEKKKLSYVKSGLLGLIAGVSTMFAIAGWGGGAAFLFMIFPIAFLVRWFTKNDKSMWNYILFYGLFITGTLLSAIAFGFEPSYILARYMTASTGILTLFALGYSLIETVIVKTKSMPKKIKENSEIASIISVFVLGGIFYQAFIGNFFSMILGLIEKIIYPFGTGRVGLTVAENKQPYLTELIAQVGKAMFYTFLAGCFIVGGKIASGIRNKKLRPLFIGSFIFFIVGILFSRVSPSSILNGTNFISKALFFISFLAIAASSIYIYKKSDWSIDMKWIFIAAWMIPMLLAVRSAIRVFFAIVPFIAMMVPLALFEVGKWGRKHKDDLTKMISISAIIIVSILLIISMFGFYKSVSAQAQSQGPSYNSDWQKAMGWVRNNTDEGSIFLHWWDYGYWVQTGGDRPTVTDGGHANGYWDHLVGRYVLTTPYPETAKSFMMAHNVSYLLIDPTDVGKYSAYSSIGDDEEVSDRASYIFTMVSDPAETQETRNGTTRLYRGGAMLDEDIRYKDDTQDVFLPKGKAGIGAVRIKKTNTGYTQPSVIYIYNNKQYTLPMRYLSIAGQRVDFGSGVNATGYIYANVVNSASGQTFDQDGALMYMSAKTMNSLVAKLYLMEDPDNEYPELELVHSESPYPMPFNYGGFRGAIKIYKVNTENMTDIIPRE